MKMTVKARINWTPVEDGGRKHMLPVGVRYNPLITFEGEQVSEKLWSAEVFNTVINGRTTEADVSYLSDDAPFNLLQAGKKFLLYEGQQVVAKGVVL